MQEDLLLPCCPPPFSYFISNAYLNLNSTLPMINKERYYQPNGDLNITGVITTLGLGVLAAVLLGFVYGIVAFYNPLIYLGFLGAWFSSIGLAWVVNKAAVTSKQHTPMVTIVIGAVVGLVAIYAAWVGWLYAMSEYSALLLNPADIFFFMSLFAEEGIYEIFGWVPKGAALYGIWGLEALIIVGGTVFQVIGGVDRRPYCDSCDQWTTSEVITTNAKKIGVISKAVGALERRDMSALTDLKFTDGKYGQFSQVLVNQCKSCGGPKYLWVQNVEVSFDDDGNQEVAATTVVENLIISNSEYDELKQWAAKLLEEGLSMAAGPGAEPTQPDETPS